MKGVAKGVIPGQRESTVAVKMLKGTELLYSFHLNYTRAATFTSILYLLTLAEGSSDKIKKDFLGEAHMLAKFRHPNVLGLLRVVTKSEPILVILPYMPNGDLRGFLRR